MKVLEELFNKNWFSKVIESIVVIVISLIIYQIIDFIFERSVNQIKKLSNKKLKTYIRLFRSITKYIFIVIVILILLQINGVDISSMVAGIGVIGIVIGFAIQDALKDIIKGFTIVSDSYYKVGDVIKFENNTGKVLSIGLITTKIEDIDTLNIVSISNRNVEKVEILSNLINIDIPFPYELSISKSEKVLKEIVDKIKKMDKVDNVEYRGVNKLADSSINYQIKVYTEPVNIRQVRRDSLREILLVLEDNNISVPYNQLDVHTKK